MSSQNGGDTSSGETHRLSRLMLGTVQLGMPYGVANRTGQPDYRQVLQILEAALQGGVNCFDTAASYGTSEQVLGQALHELNAAERVTVVTKVRPLNPVELADPVLAARAIEDSVAQSRRRLQLDCLPVVLFHREADARYSSVLADLRSRGWLRGFGVSCDNKPGPASQFVAKGCFSALQIPGNILDRRHMASGVFAQMAATGMTLFIRSVYLQGLLVMPEADVPAALQQVIPARRRLAALAADSGMDLSELALRYMLSQTEVTCVITGVETVQQIKDNLAMFNRGTLPRDLLAAIDRTALDLPEMIVSPGQWPPRGS